MVEHERTGPVDFFTWRFSRLAMILPAVIVTIMSYEVFKRYVMEEPTLWVNEASLWMGGFVYLFSGLYAMQQRSHIRIVILYDIVPRNVRRVFDTIGVICIVIFCAAVIYGGFGEAWAKMMRWEKFGTAWDPPIPATMKPAILLTLLFVTLQAISNLIYDWNRDPVAHDATDEVDFDIEEIRRAQAKIDADLAAKKNRPAPKG
ncbi:TRAP transporter small permease subunit [Oceaniglobus roseus]|uniref:TRAP transporter small permease subunit n=1 Tax=Oceaniglobus roseus TaxID=1737570 RepID=UPI000C7EB8E5|nr:TRAP transporter small permease [Kandeliimicrobium roseum]